ncbi:SH24B protein, partial [Polypterus senegalus]
MKSQAHKRVDPHATGKQGTLSELTGWQRQLGRREKEAEIERKFRDAMAKEKARFAAEKWREETKIQEELRKREEEERQHGEEEIRLTEEKRAKELYISLKQQHDDRQNDREDKEWQEQLRKSKAADKARKEKARCARNESNRQSLRAIEKGRVAGLSGLFQKTSINDTGSTRQNSASIANTTSSPVAVTDPAQLIKSEQNHRHVMTTGHPASDRSYMFQTPNESRFLVEEEVTSVFLQTSEGKGGKGVNDSANPQLGWN